LGKSSLDFPWYKLMVSKTNPMRQWWESIWIGVLHIYGTHPYFCICTICTHPEVDRIWIFQNHSHFDEELFESSWCCLENKTVYWYVYIIHKGTYIIYIYIYVPWSSYIGLMGYGNRSHFMENQT
jgi:hypothetical protein